MFITKTHTYRARINILPLIHFSILTLGPSVRDEESDFAAVHHSHRHQHTPEIRHRHGEVLRHSLRHKDSQNL